MTVEPSQTPSASWWHTVFRPGLAYFIAVLAVSFLVTTTYFSLAITESLVGPIPLKLFIMIIVIITASTVSMLNGWLLQEHVF